MALFVPITKYRQIKRLRNEAVKKVEEVTKEFEELKETTQEYKQKYEDLLNQQENLKRMSLGRAGDETDGGTLRLSEDAYKEESIQLRAWPSELKVKDLANMSMAFLHSGVISKDVRGSRTSLKGTLSVKPLEITIINLSKKTTLQMVASIFKSGRFVTQPSGAIETGESQTFSVSSKDGRAKTGVKGGLAFIVYDVKHEEEPMQNGDVEFVGEDAEVDQMPDRKKSKKEMKNEKKEKKRMQKQSKKEKKKAKEENGIEKADEENEKNNNDVIEEESEYTNEVVEEEHGQRDENGEMHENNDEHDLHNTSTRTEVNTIEDLPEGNGDFFVCAFENPLAGLPKSKCSKTASEDILPLIKQLKNDKPSQQELFGHYKGGKRHFVFIWKDSELEW